MVRYKYLSFCSIIPKLLHISKILFTVSTFLFKIDLQVSAFLILSTSVLLVVCDASPVVRVVNEQDSENSLPDDVIYRYDR